MYNTKEEIAKIENMIKKYSKRESKIENANYILAMQLDKIRKGELLSVEDIAKWDFDMIRVGDEVISLYSGKNNCQMFIDEFPLNFPLDK
jgi:hypothetical protein